MSQAILGILRGEADTLQVIQEMGDIEYLSKKQFDGKLFKEISAEFSGNAVQISHIVPSGKTFYLVSAKLYPAGTDTVTASFSVNTNVSNTNSVEIDLAFDGVLKDVLTYQYFARQNDSSSDLSSNANIGQFDSNIIDSFDGDGIKTVTLTSTNTSGTYRVSLMGFEEDTLTDPTILASSITVDATVAGDTGDLVFIQEKVLSSNYFQVSGDIDNINDTIEFIVPNNKTAFMIEAKIMPNNAGLNNRITADFKIDTVKKDEAEIFRSQAQQLGATNFGGSGYGMAENNGKFNVLGLSLVGDGIKVIEIENTNDGGGAFATMSGYLIDT